MANRKITCTIVTCITGAHVYTVNSWDEARSLFYAWYDGPARWAGDLLTDSF
jgi:hypothetical protein